MVFSSSLISKVPSLVTSALATNKEVSAVIRYKKANLKSSAGVKVPFIVCCANNTEGNMASKKSNFLVIVNGFIYTKAKTLPKINF